MFSIRAPPVTALITVQTGQDGGQLVEQAGGRPCQSSTFRSIRSIEIIAAGRGPVPRTGSSSATGEEMVAAMNSVGVDGAIMVSSQRGGPDRGSRVRIKLTAGAKGIRTPGPTVNGAEREARPASTIAIARERTLSFRRLSSTAPGTGSSNPLCSSGKSRANSTITGSAIDVRSRLSSQLVPPSGRITDIIRPPGE